VDGARVTGVAARDSIGGQCFDIRARLVINAAGPWAEGLLEPLAQRYGAPGTYSRDACFMISRRFAAPMALAVQGRTRDSDALLARNSRHLFLVPWRDCTLVGVWHSIVPRKPDSVALEREELRQFIDEFNTSYPALRLTESDVRRVDFGLVPFGEASRQNGGLSFGKESRVIDHHALGLSGLLSVISVRYTVARRDAVQALDLAAAQLGGRTAVNESATRPLPGGDIENFNQVLHAVTAKRPHWLPSGAVEPLLRNYGTCAAQILALAESDPRLARCFSGSDVSHAEALFAARAEMVQHMSDVVLRRTGLGTNGHPGAQALDEMQELLSREFGWSARRIADERALLERHFARYLAPVPRTLEPVEPADAPL
jgi:glycerol-3-phosphate dehydrogenase